VEWSGSAGLWRPGDLTRWTVYRILGPATRADLVVSDAGRRGQRAYRGRFTRPAGRSGVGARRPVDHLVGGGSRRPTPLPRTVRRPLPPIFVKEYSVDPTWAPDGRLVVYSGSDIGAAFSVKAVTADAAPHPLPALTLSRGARHPAFLHGGRALVFLRADIQHKNLWLIDLETGAERQLTSFAPDFDIRDFDISKDGQEVVLERVQERSDVVLLDPRDRNPASTSGFIDAMIADAVASL